MSNVYLTSEAYEAAINTIVQYLTDAGYEGSLEDGTGIFDAVIKPNALLYSLFSQAVKKAQAYMSLQRAEDLSSELTEDEYDDAVDCVLSNWFVSRNEGTCATGNVRLFFSQCPEYLGFEDGDTVATYDSITFVANGTTAFGESDFKTLVNTTTDETEYYADIPVVATEASSTYIPQDATFTASTSDIYFLRAQATSDFTSGTEEETSDEFIERTKEVITTRELITSRALLTVLPDEFAEIRKIYVAGHGEPEMMRDVVTFSDVSVHVGNMADIWIAAELVKSTETCVVADDGTITLTNSPCHIVSITEDDSGEEVPFTLEIDPYTWLRPGVEPTTLTVDLSAIDTDDEDEDDEEDEDDDEDSTQDSTDDDSSDTSDDTSSDDSDSSTVTTETYSDRYTDTDGNTVSYTVTIVTKGSTVTATTVTTTTYTDGTAETTTRVVTATDDGTTVVETDADGNETVYEGSSTYEEEDDDDDDDDDDETTVTVTMYTSTLPARVQEFIYDDDHRVASYDPQVRLMVPVLMNFDLTVTFDDDIDDDTEDEDIELIKETIVEYIEDLSNSSSLSWSQSETVKRIHAAVDDVVSITLPITCTATYFDIDNSEYVTLDVENTIDLKYTDGQVTSNTIQLYTNDSMITVNGE